jgi:hypothetical protein
MTWKTRIRCQGRSSYSRRGGWGRMDVTRLAAPDRQRDTVARGHRGACGCYVLLASGVGAG